MNVLVLCQRKTGIHYSGKWNVEDIIIPEINNIVKKLIGSVHKITYMTDMTEETGHGTIDIDCKLDGLTDCSKDFIVKNKNTFDLIILQTCPFILMDYPILYNLLKKDSGIVVLAAFPSNILDRNTTIESTIKKEYPGLFTYQEDKDNGIIILKKIIEKSDGKRRKRRSVKKSKRRSLKKSKRRSLKKVKKYKNRKC